MRVPLSISTAALLIVAGGLAVMRGETADAGGNFNPTFYMSIEDSRVYAVSGFNLEVTLPAKDYNIARSVFVTPSEWTVTPGDLIPIGEPVGEVNTNTIVGIFNAPCTQVIPLPFDLLNASIDTSQTIAFGDEDADQERDFAEDEDGNGFADGLDRYPEFLNRMFASQQPLRRYAGITILTGVPTLLQYITFPPGADIPGLGVMEDYASVLLLEDFGDTQRAFSPAAITNFCAPWDADIHLRGRTENGVELFRNPDAGNYGFSAIMTFRRDTDGDGYENFIDTCPFIPNLGDPTVSADGDFDSDGLDAACDPNDDPFTGGTNSDEDNDGYQNRQDNCPLVMNGYEEDNQADGDADDIGDACDVYPGTPDGSSVQVTRTLILPVTGVLSPPLSGDVDCDGEVTSRDAQVIIRSVVGNPIELPTNCPEPGEVIG